MHEVRLCLVAAMVVVVVVVAVVEGGRMVVTGSDGGDGGGSGRDHWWWEGELDRIHPDVTKKTSSICDLPSSLNCLQSIVGYAADTAASPSESPWHKWSCPLRQIPEHPSV